MSDYTHNCYTCGHQMHGNDPGTICDTCAKVLTEDEFNRALEAAHAGDWRLAKRIYRNRKNKGSTFFAEWDKVIRDS